MVIEGIVIGNGLLYLHVALLKVFYCPEFMTIFFISDKREGIFKISFSEIFSATPLSLH